jgi:hypothetical protein
MRFHFNALNLFTPISINGTRFNSNCLLANRERPGQAGSRILYRWLEEQCWGGRRRRNVWPSRAIFQCIDYCHSFKMIRTPPIYYLLVTFESPCSLSFLCIYMLYTITAENNSIIMREKCKNNPATDKSTRNSDSMKIKKS